MGDFLPTSIRRTVKDSTPREWQQSLQNLLNSTASQVSLSSAEREQSGILRCTRDAAVRRALNEAEFALELRAQATRALKTDLCACQEASDREIEAQAEVRKSLFAALQSLNLPINVNTECVVIRERRKGGDRVNDTVQAKLAQEAEELATSKRSLEKLIEASVLKEKALKDWRNKITLNMRDKQASLEIEDKMMDLAPVSAGISFKPEPTTEPRDSQNEDSWFDTSTRMMANAYRCVDDSRRQRDEAKKTSNQLLAACRALGIEVDFAFRQQLHAHTQALRSLDWQKSEAKIEMESLEYERRKLNSCLDAKDPPLQVAETRLTERREKPFGELVNDSAQAALRTEWETTKTSIALLEEKLTRVAMRLNALDQHIYELSRDIDVKTHAKNMDEQCQRIRQKTNDPVQSGSSGQLIKHSLTPHTCMEPA